MDLQAALKEQYRAGLAMLAECVEKCPDDLWTAGEHPRPFWRIAFHAAFFTQLYLGADETVFEPWPGCHESDLRLFADPAYLEPYELPEETAPYTQKEMLDYIAFVDSRLDSLIDALDLERDDPGISWYKNITKLSFTLMNLRHIQGHVGQLSELLMARGIDTDWVARGQ
ncbi:MAG TPA: DinB family protein [Fimbriimonadaceae bacterium]|nr:DinB family protein [Fimbriimonadaceae bacterium]